MKKIPSILVLFAFLLGACSGGSTAATEAPAATKEAVLTEAPVAASTATEAAPTEAAAPSREASLSDVKNEVTARTLGTDEFVAATVGMSILPTGGVETGAEGRARLDLLPEGTIVRVGPNSSFTMPELTEENGEPKTTLELLFGKVYILLNGGSLEVKTPTGVAMVRGSLMRVEYDPETGKLKASCLEGHCSLANEDGEMVELEAGEYTYIEGDYPPIDPPMLIDSSEIEEWLAEISELDEFLDEIPDPDDYPDNENGDENGNDDNTNDNNENEEENNDNDGGNDNGGYPNP